MITPLYKKCRNWSMKKSYRGINKERTHSAWPGHNGKTFTDKVILALGFDRWVGICREPVGVVWGSLYGTCYIENRPILWPDIRPCVPILNWGCFFTGDFDLPVSLSWRWTWSPLLWSEKFILHEELFRQGSNLLFPNYYHFIIH